MHLHSPIHSHMYTQRWQLSNHQLRVGNNQSCTVMDMDSHTHCKITLKHSKCTHVGMVPLKVSSRKNGVCLLSLLMTPPGSPPGLRSQQPHPWGIVGNHHTRERGMFGKDCLRWLNLGKTSQVALFFWDPFKIALESRMLIDDLPLSACWSDRSIKVSIFIISLYLHNPPVSSASGQRFCPTV